MNDLERRLNNLCQIGVLSEVDNSKFVAKVKINERSTDFFQVFSQEGAFKQNKTALSVGEQVIVLCPFGNANIGFILRGLCGDTPLSGGDDEDITEYSDGTKIVKSLSSLSISSPVALEITAPNFSVTKDGDMTITGKITDSKGNLTSHTHIVKEHTTAIERS